jgi:hypothetical protein
MAMSSAGVIRLPTTHPRSETAKMAGKLTTSFGYPEIVG